MNDELMFSAAGQQWRTEPALVAYMRQAFGQFDLDAAAEDDLIAPTYHNLARNALRQKWGGRAYCNSPYDAVGDFVSYGLCEVDKGHCSHLLMLAAARTDTAWFQKAFSQWTAIYFLKGRIKFWLQPWELEDLNDARAAKGKKPINAENSAPFPSCLLWRDASHPLDPRGPYVRCLDWRGDTKLVDPSAVGGR